MRNLSARSSQAVLAFVFWVCFQSIALAEVRLGVMAANITSGNKQSYDPGHGTRIFTAFRDDIDVFLIQEFNYGDNSDAAIRGWIDRTFGKQFSVYREKGRTDTSDGYKIPNGIVSRYPIVDSGSFKDPVGSIGDRGFAWAKIKLPNGKFVWAISLHLSHGSDKNRQREADALVNKFLADLRASGKMGPNDYVVAGGDFNLQSRNEQALQILGTEFNTTRQPKDVNQNGNTSTNRSKPYDVVIANKALDQHHVGITVPGVGTFPDGFVFDSRCTPLAQLAPIMKGDSNATNMQHMPVMTTYMIP